MSPAAPRRLLAALMLTIGVVACAKRAIPDPQFAGCPGDRVIIVSNTWSVPVDVYATVAGRTAPMVIGTVSPGGREEIVMPLDARNAYVRATEPMRGGVTQRPEIRIRYLCR